MRAAIGAAALTALIVGLVGCSPDERSPRSNVTIRGINGGLPVYSDVVNYGEDGNPGTDDDGIVEDPVIVQIANNPLQDQLSLDRSGPFGNVTIDEYRISFDPATEIDPVGGGIHVSIATRDTVEFAVVAVPIGHKMQSPLWDLRSGGQILTTAHLELWGTERTSGDEIYADGRFTVSFANFADQTDED